MEWGKDKKQWVGGRKRRQEEGKLSIEKSNFGAKTDTLSTSNQLFWGNKERGEARNGGKGGEESMGKKWVHSKKKRRWGRGSRDGGGVEGGMEEGKRRGDRLVFRFGVSALQLKLAC